jgi:hypothetical protein
MSQLSTKQEENHKKNARIAANQLQDGVSPGGIHGKNAPDQIAPARKSPKSAGANEVKRKLVDGSTMLTMTTNFRSSKNKYLHKV